MVQAGNKKQAIKDPNAEVRQQLQQAHASRPPILATHHYVLDKDGITEISFTKIEFGKLVHCGSVALRTSDAAALFGTLYKVLPSSSIATILKGLPWQQGVNRNG